jgi:hypothetical protein
MHQYLEGCHFIVITDHQALTWFGRIYNPEDYEVRYRRGSVNVLANPLSWEKCGVTTSDLKCIWYSRKFQEVSENPNKDENYKISENRLFKKVFTSLNFRDNDEWKVCVP